MNEIGAVSWTDRQIEEAIGSHQESREILEQIDADQPRLQREVLFEQAWTGYLLGRRGRGRLGGVPMRSVIARRQQLFDERTRSGPHRTETVRDAIKILEQLVEQYSGKPEYRHLLALCYRETSKGEIRTDGPADDPVARSIALLEQLVQEYPNHPAYRYSLCTSLQWLNLLQDTGEQAMQIAAARVMRAIAIAVELSQERPDEWIYSAAEVEAQLLLAKVQTQRGLVNEALASCSRAIEVGSQLAGKYPNYISFRYWLGFAHQATGHILRDSGAAEAALQSYDQAMKLFNDVLRVQPDWGHVVLHNLAGASSERATILAASGRGNEGKNALLETQGYTVRLEQALSVTE